MANGDDVVHLNDTAAPLLLIKIKRWVQDMLLLN